MRVHWMVLVVLAVVVAGCTVGPDYRAPETTVPAAYGQQPAAATQPGTQPAAEVIKAADLVNWWRSLGDPMLDRLIAQAKLTNLDLAAAEARVREARALRRIAGAEQYPTLNAGGSYTRQRSSANLGPEATRQFSGGGQELDIFQVGFDAAWELDVFGRVRRGIESTDAQVAATIAQREDVLVTLLAETARNYVELRGAQLRLEIARRNLAVQRDTLDLTQARFQGGQTSELEVAQARTQLASTQSVVPGIETNIRQTIHRLGVLLGEAPGALQAELIAPAPIPPAPPAIPIGMPSDLLRRRPDIRQAERQLAAATARIGVATADLYPRFTISGTLGLAASDASNLFSAASRAWSIGPAMSWPIFQGGRIRGNIEAEEARTEQAMVAYRQSILLALEEVENALVAYNQERVRYQSLQEAVAASERAVELATMLNKRGLTSFLNVLESQRALFATQDTLAQSQRALTTSAIALYKALGGGWEAPAAVAGAGVGEEPRE